MATIGASFSACAHAVSAQRRGVTGSRLKCVVNHPPVMEGTATVGATTRPLSSRSNTGRRQLTLLRAATADAKTEKKTKQDYEAVIGIETHVQLSTETKAFCSCANEYGAEANTHVCPVCLGHPGTLPVLNAAMVAKAVAAGVALGSKIAPSSKFDRKQYFYADLPKGYQISQYDEPICSGGSLEIQVPGQKAPKVIGITRAHIEEDAGKLVHGGAASLGGSTHSLVDYNRAGVPLLEIVSEPDLRSGEEAAEFGAELQRVMRTIGAGNGNMQEGSMRCDVNVSVRPRGQAALGTKVEVKNMNSFSAMQKAIEFEVARQSALLDEGRGGAIVQETRLWDEANLCTYSMRRKEGLADYRYFPEPDLPPALVTDEILAAVRASMPELPAARRQRFLSLGLPKADALLLADDHVVAAYFDAVLKAGAKAKPAANWIMGDIMAHCKNERVTFDGLPLSPVTLAEMVALIDDGTISGKIAKEVLPKLLQGEGGAGLRAYVEERGLVQVSDPAVIGEWIDDVLGANPEQLAQFRGGKTKLQGFFVGQLMKVSKGQGNPAVMNKMLNERLKGEN